MKFLKILILILIIVVSVGFYLVNNSHYVQDRLLERAITNLVPDQFLDEDDTLRAIVCGSRSPVPSPNRAQTCVLVEAGDDIYIVDTFGDTKKFLKKCSIVFLGGSIIPHGGQNPIEAARYGLKIIHGPNIENFTEVYNLLKSIGLSYQIKSRKDAFNVMNKVLKHKLRKNLNVNRLNLMGQKILIKNYNYISKYL